MTRKRIFMFSAMILVAALGLLIWWLSSLQPRNLIVLVEDPKGKVGVVEVGNDYGRQVLTKLREATGASSATEAPRVPFIMSEKDVQKIFGGVLGARPVLPSTFTLNFQPGVSIFASSGPEIDQITAEIQRRPVSRVSIYGYASATGNVPLNLATSLFRARAVRSALESRGIDTRDFLIDAILDRSAAGSAPAQGGTVIPNNRRVDVVIR